MSILDWFVLLAFLAYTIWDGTRSGSKAASIRDYFLAGRSMPWWAMGLSVMATQASAITFISATGLAFMEDMRFVQVYLAVPFAMVILSLTIVPFFYKKEVYSAYEVLEERFGLGTRLLTSGLFLVSRGLALGTVIAAPAYVLALILGLPLWITILIIGITATIYTMLGGVVGVIKTDVKQMAIMLFGVFFALFWVWYKMPPGIGMAESVQLAGALGKLNSLSLNFDISDKYNLWSGVLASLFLMLSYFGSDQTQVQRYLTAKSLKDAQNSLLLSAVAKVPMQFIILFLGVMMYIFYIFHPGPLSFRTAELEGYNAQDEIGQTLRESHFNALQSARTNAALAYVESGADASKAEFYETDAAVRYVRDKELRRLSEATGTEFNDTNYIFPYFIITEMPAGIIGLIIAAIFAAALSSIDSALNALSTCSIVDWYQRLHRRKRSDIHYLRASRLSTLIWGIVATAAALALGETNSIIELVNQIGSYFYGSILGVFILMLYFRKVHGKAAVIALISGMMVVFLADLMYVQHGSMFLFGVHDIPAGAQKMWSYLWLNPIGTGTVVLVGWVTSILAAQTQR